MTRALLAMMLVASCGKSSLLLPPGDGTDDPDLAAAGGRFDLGVSTKDGGGPRDGGGPKADMDRPKPQLDMGQRPDMTPKSPTCGDIVMCAIGCGANFSCVFQCQQGASQEERQNSQALFTCGLRHCTGALNPDGGFSQQRILQCMAMHCSSELTDCFGFGP